jgi:Na+:H+ antiporter, NhaA family
MGAALAALIVANSPVSDFYFRGLAAYVGPLSVSHWVNDGLMAVFFLLVGLEIKREMLDGQLSTWPRRILPGIAAIGGMAVPAVVYILVNRESPDTLRGWAIPTATDIAFALGILSLLGKRVPASLKLFLTALAIIDDLGAVVVIALFYTEDISRADLGAAAVILMILFALNRRGVLYLIPYVMLGIVLWIFVYRSGIHATLAGVALAMMVPLRRVAWPCEGRRLTAPPHGARTPYDCALCNCSHIWLCECRRISIGVFSENSDGADRSWHRRRPCGRQNLRCFG